MKRSELNEKTIEELIKLKEERLEEHRNARFTEVLGSLSNPARIKHVRRDIAQIKTRLRENELSKINTIDAQVFENDILAKLLSETKKNLLLKCYTKDDSNAYQMKENLNKRERSAVKHIFKSMNYLERKESI